MMRSPAAYRPGSLLAKLRADLAGLDFQQENDTQALFRCRQTGVEFQTEERVEARFLMHIVSTRFSYRVPVGGGAPAKMRLRHRGAWKRTGIECTVDQGHPEVAERLATDPTLAAAMLPLDFTDFQLERQSTGWIASLVHYGASEVVYQFPATRQYVRLAPQQLQSILRTFSRLPALLA